MVRRSFAAPWLGWLSLALAGVNVVSAISSQTAMDGGLLAVQFIGTIGFGVVILIVSIYMVRDDAAAAPARPEPRLQPAG